MVGHKQASDVMIYNGRSVKGGLEANQNKNKYLVSNFLDILKSPALFSHLFRTEKSAGNFNLSKKLLTRQLISF